MIIIYYQLIAKVKLIQNQGVYVYKQEFIRKSI